MTQWRQQKATSNRTPTETGTRYSQHPACRSSSETTETQPSNSSQYPLHSPRETIGAQHRPSPLQSNTVARAFDMGLRRRRTQRTNQHTKTHVESQTLAAPRHKHRPLSTSRRKLHERRLRLHREFYVLLHVYTNTTLWHSSFCSSHSSPTCHPARHDRRDIAPATSIPGTCFRNTVQHHLHNDVDPLNIGGRRSLLTRRSAYQVPMRKGADFRTTTAGGSTHGRHPLGSLHRIRSRSGGCADDFAFRKSSATAAALF